MPRILLDESSVPANYQRDDCKKRRKVLKDTLDKFAANPVAILDQAHTNQKLWADNANPIEAKVSVLPGDWGDVTLQRAKLTGQVYAVLNMANAYHPGGGYLEGAVAQEENMFRRTDCHFYIRDEDMNASKDRYTKQMTDLINAENGIVPIDKDKNGKLIPRVCIKGGETQNGDGYPDLAPEEYFEFYELKAAADDLRGNKPFNEASMRKKIAAQLETLKANNIRHVILSAFGCGAFANPANLVAQIYREELEKRPDYFDDVVFAVYHAGYGPDNFTPFKEILDGLPLKKAAPAQIQERNPDVVIQQQQPLQPVPQPPQATQQQDYASVIAKYKTKLADPEWDKRGYVFLFFDYRKAPKGIVQMRKLLSGTQSDQDKLKGLKKIAQARLNNPPLFTKRAQEVTDLYNEIITIDENALNVSPNTNNMNNV